MVPMMKTKQAAQLHLNKEQQQHMAALQAVGSTWLQNKLIN